MTLTLTLTLTLGGTVYGDRSGFHIGIVGCESALISVYSQKPQVMGGRVVLLPNENKIKNDLDVKTCTQSYYDHNRDSK